MRKIEYIVREEYVSADEEKRGYNFCAKLESYLGLKQKAGRTESYEETKAPKSEASASGGG